MFAVVSADSYSDARGASPRPIEQCVTGEDAVAVVLALVRSEIKLIGVGLGPDADRAAESARKALRGAVLRAGTSTIELLASVPSELATAAEAVLRLLARVVRDRSPAEWRVVELMSSVHGRQQEVSAELGITAQAVSHALRRSGWREECSGRGAAATLLRLADETAARPADN